MRTFYAQRGNSSTGSASRAAQAFYNFDSIIVRDYAQF